MHVRGLECQESVLDYLRQTQQVLRKKLNDEVFSMLEHWMKRAQRDKSVIAMCILRMHLAYIFKHLPDADLDYTSVSTLLSSQIYIQSNYYFDADDHSRRRPSKKDKKKGGRGGDEWEINQAIGFAQTEVFQLFQSKRWQVFQWLQANPDECDKVMEAVIRVGAGPHKHGL